MYDQKKKKGTKTDDRTVDKVLCVFFSALANTTPTNSLDEIIFSPYENLLPKWADGYLQGGLRYYSSCHPELPSLCF